MFRRLRQWFFRNGQDVNEYYFDQNEILQNNVGKSSSSSLFSIDEYYVSQQQEHIIMHSRNRNGMLPLHIVCCDRLWKWFPNEMIAKNVLLIIQAGPPIAIIEKDDYGRIPLSVALESEAPIEIINVLVQKMDNYYNNTIISNMQDDTNNTIEHHNINNYNDILYRITDNEQRLPIHIVIDSFINERWMERKQIDKMNLILSKYPNGIIEKDIYGRIPLHIAIDRDVTIGIINILLQKAPYTICHVNGKGLLPWQLAAINHVSVDTIFTLLLHDPGLFIANIKYYE